MDILDIVNSFIQNKQETIIKANNDRSLTNNELELNIDEIINKLNLDITLESISIEHKISVDALINEIFSKGYMYCGITKKWTNYTVEVQIDTLYEIVSTMYHEQQDLAAVSKKFLIPEETLIKSLEKNKFKNRWTHVGNLISSVISDKIVFYLYQLNTLNKSLEEIAESEGVTVAKIEEDLKKANYRKFWILEETFIPPYGISSVKNMKLIYDIKTGEPIVLLANGRILFTMKNVVNTLGINAKLIHNKYFQEFSKNIQYINPTEYFGNNTQIFKALPHLKYLMNDILFTERGLHLFANITNTISFHTKKIREIENILLLETKKSDALKNTLATTIEEIKTRSPKIIEPVIEKEVKLKTKELDSFYIVEKLNTGAGFSNIAKEYGVQVGSISKFLKNEGYRYDSFLLIWTKDRREIIIDDIVDELNNGITLYDISNKYRKNNKERLLFSDELRRKIELCGYKWYQKVKKWLKDGPNNRENNKINIEKITNKFNVNEENTKKVLITSEEIEKILKQGKTLKIVEEETGVDSAELRIVLKNDGFKYDSFFKTWINESRDSLLHKIAADVIYKRSTLIQIAGMYDISITELETELMSLGYNFNVEKNIKSSLSNTKSKNVPTNINQNLNESSRENGNILNLTIKEIKILRELIEERKDGKDKLNQIENSKQLVKIYISNKLLEEVEDYSEKNNLTKSDLIEKALEHFLSIWK